LHPARKIGNEDLGVIGVAFAHSESGNQFGIGVESNERPDISVNPGSLGILAFCDESPYFVNLKLGHYRK
jgi:hypothetical protein